MTSELQRAIGESWERHRQMTGNPNVKEAWEEVRKDMAASHDRSVAYTTVIMLGGYAGYFGLWQIAKEYLTKGQVLWSVLLMSISLAFFIGYEVFKMIMSTDLHEKANVELGDEATSLDLQRFNGALSRIGRRQRQWTLANAWVWNLALSVSVVSALLGAGVLVYACATGVLASS